MARNPKLVLSAESDVTVQAFKGMTKPDTSDPTATVHMVDVATMQTDNVFAPHFRFFKIRRPDDGFSGFTRRIVLFGEPEKNGKLFLDMLEEELRRDGGWGVRRFGDPQVDEKIGSFIAKLNRQLFSMKAFIRVSEEEYQLYSLAEPARGQRNIKATVRRSYEQNTPLEFRYQTEGDTPGFIRRVTVRSLDENGFKAKHALGYRRYRWDRVQAATSELFKGGVGRELEVHLTVDGEGEGKLALSTVGQNFTWAERERSMRRRDRRDQRDRREQR